MTNKIAGLALSITIGLLAGCSALDVKKISTNEFEMLENQTVRTVLMKAGPLMDVPDDIAGQIAQDIHSGKCPPRGKITIKTKYKNLLGLFSYGKTTTYTCD